MICCHDFRVCVCLQIWDIWGYGQCGGECICREYMEGMNVGECMKGEVNWICTV